MKSNDWRHKNVARYTPGNTKILYFFNCLLDGMHTIMFPVDVSFATQIRIPYFTCFALGYILSILLSGNLVSNIFVIAFSGVAAFWCLS